VTKVTERDLAADVWTTQHWNLAEALASVFIGAARRRASSRLSSLAADLRPGRSLAARFSFYCTE